jgi:hypothetical protein
LRVRHTHWLMRIRSRRLNSWWSELRRT